MSLFYTESKVRRGKTDALIVLSYSKVLWWSGKLILQGSEPFLSLNFLYMANSTSYLVTKMLTNSVT